MKSMKKTFGSATLEALERSLACVDLMVGSQDLPCEVLPTHGTLGQLIPITGRKSLLLHSFHSAGGASFIHPCFCFSYMKCTDRGWWWWFLEALEAA